MERMRLAIGQFSELTHEKLTFARQLGVGGVQLNTPVLPTDAGYWQLDDLRWMKDRAEGYGLRLEALENVPIQFLDKAMLGLPGRDEQIENYQKTIRNMGAAGIPILGYNWMPNGVWRTSRTAPGRGGAWVTAFHADRVRTQDDLVHGAHTLEALEGRTISEAEMWENYRYFTRAVLPVAEEAGVRLALHPDDPPLPSLGGVARLFYHFEGFRRAMEDVAPSPYHGLDFCLGCFSEMCENLLETVRYFGARGKLFYVHFRDVKGCADSFEECFLGEGNYDPVQVMRTLKEVGFTGFILDDHVPHLIDDSQWGHRGRAHETGFIKGLLEAVDKLC